MIELLLRCKKELLLRRSGLLAWRPELERAHSMKKIKADTSKVAMKPWEASMCCQMISIYSFVNKK